MRSNLVLVHRKPRHSQSQGSVERVNCDIVGIIYKKIIFMYITFYFILTLLNLLVVILGLFRNASNATDIDAILIRMFSQNSYINYNFS